MFKNNHGLRARLAARHGAGDGAPAHTAHLEQGEARRLVLADQSRRAACDPRIVAGSDDADRQIRLHHNRRRAQGPASGRHRGQRRRRGLDHWRRWLNRRWSGEGIKTVGDGHGDVFKIFRIGDRIASQHRHTIGETSGEADILVISPDLGGNHKEIRTQHLVGHAARGVGILQLVKQRRESGLLLFDKPCFKGHGAIRR